MTRAAFVLGCTVFTIATSLRAQATENRGTPVDSARPAVEQRAEPSSEAAPVDTLTPANVDSLTPAKEPSLAGVGFVGALAWYPGALAGAFAGAGGGSGPELRRQRRFMTAVVAGGGASTGLVVGLLTASRRRCDPVRTLGLAVLGGEIGSFAGAAATGTFGLLSSGGIALAAAPVVVPLASALVAIALVRRCR